MKRVNLGMIAVLFLLTQVTISIAASLSIDELTGDDAPDTSIGWVDRLDFDQNVIVINDLLFRLSNDTVYLSQENKLIDKNSFAGEMTVRYLYEDRVILAIWPVNDREEEYRPKPQNEEDPQTPSELTPGVSNPSELDGKIKKENGVWTN